MPSGGRDDPASDPGMAAVLRRNIRSMRRQREEEAAKASVEEQLAGAITDFTGSMRFI